MEKINKIVTKIPKVEQNNSTQSEFIRKLHSRFTKELLEINDIILESLDCDEEIIKNVGTYLLKSGGKRIRPLLTILSSKLFGYSGNNNIFLAASTEFIHAATLLHDDVVDSSLLRRFQPTANSLWGNKASILVGDFLFSQSFKLMVKTSCLKSLEVLSKASTIIAKGEVSQLSSTNSDKLTSREEYYKIIEAKTAELFAAAAKVGAIISGRSKDESDHMYNYGRAVGLIFQIKDDLMDYYSKANDSGKNTGDDFFESKITLPIIILMEKIDKNEKQIIHKFFVERKEKTIEDLNLMISLLNKYRIVEEIEKEINILNKIANESLENLKNIDEDIKNLLKELVQFSSKRAV